MTNETKGVSAEQVEQWHLDYFDGKYKHIPRSEAAEYIAKRAYEKGLADGMAKSEGLAQSLSDLYGLFMELPRIVPDEHYHKITAAAALLMEQQPSATWQGESDERY